MSVYFIRCLQHSSIRTGPSKFLRIINVQPDRNYHVENSGILRKSTNQWMAVNYSSVRNASNTPPMLPGVFSYFQWHSYQKSMVKLIEEYAQSDIVMMTTEKMIQFHDYIGLPWWSVIVITTIAARTITLPFAIHQQYVSAKYEQVLHQVDTVIDKEVTQKVNKLAAENKWDQQELTLAYHREKRERKTELIKKYNCHPLKLSILAVVQIPIWTTFSCALRNLTYMLPIQDTTAQIVYAEMKLNSFLWMSDLTTPDQYLPFFFTISNMLSVATNVVARKGKKTTLEKFLVLLHTTFCIMLCTFANDLPLSVVLYWTTSSWFSAIQNSIFLSPKIRQRLNIPLSENLRPSPIRRIVNKFKSIYKFMKY